VPSRRASARVANMRLGASAQGHSARSATSSRLASALPESANPYAAAQGHSISLPILPATANPQALSQTYTAISTTSSRPAITNPGAAAQGPSISSTISHHSGSARPVISSLETLPPGPIFQSATPTSSIASRLGFSETGAFSRISSAPSASSARAPRPAPVLSENTRVESPLRDPSITSAATQTAQGAILGTGAATYVLSRRSETTSPSRREQINRSPAGNRAQPQPTNLRNQSGLSNPNLPHRVKEEPIEAAQAPFPSQSGAPSLGGGTRGRPRRPRTPTASEVSQQEATNTNTSPSPRKGSKRKANTVKFEPDPQRAAKLGARETSAAAVAGGSSAQRPTNYEADPRIMKMRFEFKLEIGREHGADRASDLGESLSILCNEFNQKRPGPLYEMYASAENHSVEDDPSKWKIYVYDDEDNDLEEEHCKLLQPEIVRRITGLR
jgi:hypothetical protein